MVEDGAESALTLSEQGRIEGDIQVPNVILNGTVVGDVYASERVELAPKAKVTGTVYYNLLEMTMGAEVNGQLIHTKDAQPQMLGYDGNQDNVEPLKTTASESREAAEETSETIPRGR